MNPGRPRRPPRLRRRCAREGARPGRPARLFRAPRPVRVLAVVLFAAGGCGAPSTGGSPGAAGTEDVAALQTRGEATDWVETSRHADVVSFMETVAAASDGVHLTTMGYTMEGRSIPMAVVGDVADASPEAVAASGRLVVYLQGDIHGGEVPGKEALLMLLRGIATGEYPDWSDRLVLLVAPLYNADGNERVALDNRPRQHGPIGGMGQRPNAQGYDLNRDHMKLDAPEARSLVRMITAYDPYLAVDLHTTNGTRHAYHVTYSPPLHPGTHPAILELLRGEMLPAITGTIRDEHGVDFYYYGNARSTEDGMGWYTFDHRPRFNNNYVGLRNRLAILSEAYAYLTYRDRVMSTLWFVEDIVEYAHARADELRAAVEEADASAVGEELPTRATFQRSDTMVTILMGEVEEERHPHTGDVMLLRRDVETPTPMWEYGTFEATDTEVVPGSYLIPPELDQVVERLRTHGIAMEPAPADETAVVQAFVLDSVQTAPRPFQGRNERTLFGAWREAERTIPAGTLVLDVAQPLGRLAFYLLEPRSDDGFANWGIFDDALEGAEEYPILRRAEGGG